MLHTRLVLSWRLLTLLFFLSGIPALVYQVAWQRQLTLISGIGNFSVSTIIAAFMVGIGLGSAFGGLLSSTLSHRRAMLCFGLIELSISGFGLYCSQHGLTSTIFPESWFIGPRWKIVIVHLTTLLFPTTLMGMTFPLLVQAIVRHGRRSSDVIGSLYAANVAGSAAGSVLGGFILIPKLGISGAIFFAAILNFIVGALSLIATFTIVSQSQDSSGISDPVNSEDQNCPTIPLWYWYLAYTLSGFNSIGLEIVWFRMVDVATKSTSFTFSIILGIYLTGISAGTFFGNRLIRRYHYPLLIFLIAQFGVVGFTILPVLLIVHSVNSIPFANTLMNYWQSYEPIAVVYLSSKDVMIFYVYLPMFLFLLPTFCMGVSFVSLQDGIQSIREKASLRVGLLQASNIAGCILGSLLTGLFLLSFLKTSGVLQVLFTASLVIFVGSFLLVGYRIISAMLSTLVIVAILCVPKNSMIWERFHGQKESSRLTLIESETGVISLLDEGGRYRVSNNGKGQSYIPFGGVHSKLGITPVIVHGNPQRLAIIGLGSGDTAWAAACLPTEFEMDVFEICTDQWTLLSQHSGKFSDRLLSSLINDKRIHLIPEDGRIGIAKRKEGYDLIEADAIRSNGAFAGNLYSREFFTLCKKRLRPGGIMCTWAPTKRTALTFRSVFPTVIELDGGQILIGCKEKRDINQSQWQQRLQIPEVTTYITPEILRECSDALKSAQLLPPLSEKELEIPVNSDDHPLDEFEIPFPAKKIKLEQTIGSR